MKAKLEDVLSGEVETPAGEYKIIAGDLDYVFTALDSGNADLWRRMHAGGEFCQAFSKVWPASCDWIVEWEECTLEVQEEG